MHSRVERPVRDLPDHAVGVRPGFPGGLELAVVQGGGFIAFADDEDSEGLVAANGWLDSAHESADQSEEAVHEAKGARRVQEHRAAATLAVTDDYLEPLAVRGRRSLEVLGLVGHGRTIRRMASAQSRSTITGACSLGYVLALRGRARRR